MKTLRWYLFKLHLTYIAVAFIFLTSLFLLLDISNNADRVLSQHQHHISALGKYILLTIPNIGMLMMPFSILLASLLFLSRLSQNREIMAAKACGIAFHRFFLSLMPTGILMMVLFFLGADKLVPYTSQELVSWEQQSFKSSDQLISQVPLIKSLWLKEGNDFIAIENVYADGTYLTDITLFKRGKDSSLLQQITAETASWQPHQGWILQNGQVFNTEIRSQNIGYKSEPFTEMAWPTTLKPTNIMEISKPGGDLTLSELYRFSQPTSVGFNPLYYYESWFYRRLSSPFMCLIMILLASTAAQLLPRKTNIAQNLMIGVGLGFSYFVIDGIMLTFGQSGILSPLIAAISPLAIFGAIGLWGLMRNDA